MPNTRNLIFVLLLLTLPAYSADRMDDLDREIQRQEQKYRQEQIGHFFNKLEEHFSSHDIEQMKAGQMDGVELSRLSDEQTIALHDLLSASLSSLGYSRAINLLGFQKIQNEMGFPDNKGRLYFNNSEQQTVLMLHTPTFALTLERNGMVWEVSSLYFGHQPHQVMPAPVPDLSKSDIHYPYVRWSEAVGSSPLGQTAKLAIRTLNEIPIMERKNGCQGSADATATHCPLSLTKIDESGSVSVNNLDAQARYLLRSLAMELQSHLPAGQNQHTPDIELRWAGDIPSQLDEDINKNLLVTLSGRSGSWQILITGSTPPEMEARLPANTLVIRYEKDGIFEQDISSMTTVMENMVSPPEQTSREMMSVTTMEDRIPARNAGMNNEVMNKETTNKETVSNNDSEKDFTWLKDPAFLNGMALSIGYEGTMVNFTKPFIPVVRVKKEGRIHKNIRVTISLGAEAEELWLKDLPLVFSPESKDYRTNLHLPASMEGKSLILKYSVHEPGTRYEGLYEYKIDTETGKATPNILF